MERQMKLAMDKRTTDKFGRMRVDESNISKAAVNPYYGHEIPNAEALGLDLQAVYHLLRDPEEMAKAADTFNLLPILSKHIPVSAAAPSQELVVGSTGTDAAFDEPYLRNSLVLTEAEAILGVVTGTKHELSSAYAYDADMTPGTYGGVKYDGVMRNIVGNHVALVFEGRAGPDVVVGDSKLLEKPKMKKLSPRGGVLLGALMAISATAIAQDAQIGGDLRTIAGGVKDLSTVKERTTVVKAVRKLAEGKQGMALDGLDDLVEKVAETEVPAAPNAMDDENGGDFATQLATLLGTQGMTPEVSAKIQAMCAGGAMDEDPKPDDKKDDDKVDKPAMDAALAASGKAIRESMLAVRNAEIEVRPIVGDLSVAMDSAADVYKLALDHMKVDLTCVAPAAYRAVFNAVKAQAAVVPPAKRLIAQDAAMSGGAAFATLFPNAAKPTGSA